VSFTSALLSLLAVAFDCQDFEISAPDYYLRVYPKSVELLMPSRPGPEDGRKQRTAQALAKRLDGLFG
jgi:hypothetical protein